MKHNIHVKHTHRYTHEQMTLFLGEAEIKEYDGYYEYIYYDEQRIKTVLKIFEDKMEIQRYGEATSSLLLIENERTLNPISSPYGTFEIEIFTYAYKNENNYIMVEYDVENGSEDKDGFKIEIRVEEKSYEFH